ncbi:hypothetical protein CKALI_05885 [Corynebacterium kalinowskii]|uniref:Uncharacterized protein n=1 Tax=Corynebacterium kalinowskii TaxID=2675216 RepID=A0A6B8VTG4_9CORY|nr:DUF6676 family protein [Corynebacterium kalinowskii]QGU02046.1 hypothetical protein CKALI_05885 [Corynebacterium kalinowskii]
MTLENIDVASLREQINVDSVAIGDLGVTYPSLEQELIDASRHGMDTGFGRTAFVVLDDAPTGIATTRDVAQELLNTTSFDTIIVRSPYSGAIVSHDYSRAAIESAQYDFLANPQIANGAREFMDTLNGQFYPWSTINIIIGLVVILVVAFTAWITIRQAKSLDR